MSFEALGLPHELSQAAAALDMREPNNIQRQTIPAMLGGCDVLVQSPTGSGKTAAYVLPLVQHLAKHGSKRQANRTRALILVPTRELAQQVAGLLTALLDACHPSLRTVTAVGGLSINPQMMALRGGSDVLVATPGRLLDLIRQGALKLDAVSLCVLDEADRLMDTGFADELRTIWTQLPEKRQTAMFSATFTRVLEALASDLMKAPVQRISASAPSQEDTSAAPLIRQRAILVDSDRRSAVLRHLLDQANWPQTLVFVASQYAADHLARKLHRGDRFVTSFHGGLSQGARRQTLDEFKDGRWDVLITTDLAARGLHIDQLPLVVNYDLPRSAQDHTHRIGRTGRAGAEGQAVSLVQPAMLAHWRLICKRTGQAIEPEAVPGHEPTETASPPGVHEHGGIKGKRPSKKDKLRAAAAAANAAAQSSVSASGDVASGESSAGATGSRAS